MDLTSMLNRKGEAAAAAGPDQQLRQQLQAAANGQAMSEAGSRAGSPHGSEHSYANGRMTMRYPSPTAMGQSPLPMLPGYHAPYNGQMPQQDPNRAPARQTAGDGAAVKAFPCKDCGKGFARRSDLARHERIHSGVRPHVCDYIDDHGKACGKQFIQRSALTVHARVHTGEKPHMCERCGKPFSDSSSLARHRRIHSGKRPYKCPYADCQKTFTRRTTLTRHQNHHTGTVEEAAAATAAALATRNGSNRGTSRTGRSDGEQASNHGSPASTPSPGQHQMSMSPAPMGQMAPQRQEYTYMNNAALPVHLRGDYQVPSQQVPVTAAYMNNGMRPTSHPGMYGPPNVLEPPAHAERQTASASGSPHMSHAGWQSPSHAQSPGPAQNYVYPDPDPYGNQTAPMGQMYYNGMSHIRRPQSTEPEAYDNKNRVANELWAGGQ